MKKIIRSLIMVLAVVAAVGGATYAYLTSSAESSGNELTSGTLALDPAPQSETPGNFLPFSIGNMKPGDGTQNESAFYYRVNLKNTGTLNLKYRVKIVVDPAQKNGLYNALRVKLGEYSSGPSKVLGTNLTLDDLEAGILVDGNVKPTAEDTRARTVWFRFFLPTTIGNEAQNLSTNFGITFEATQTDNPGWN